MSKDNIFAKKLKKQFLSINDSIERNFNKIRPFVLKIKKLKFDPNNRAFLIFLIALVSIFTFFSIPAFYDKNIIQSKIKNQIFENYKIQIVFNEKLNFSIFPKPHFTSKNISIFQKDKEIAKIKKARIYISNEKIYLFNDIKIKDLIFNGSELYINKENLNFFKNLLKTNPSENEIVIKNSKIFYKDTEGEVLFISKIFNSKFFYDFNKLENNLVSKNEIFNLPFVLNIQNNYFDRDLDIQLDIKKLRLNIENSTNYKDLIKDGSLDINLINTSSKFDYEFDEGVFKFLSQEKNFYNGQVEFKPFYLLANFNYDYLNLKNLFKNDTILSELIRSEILFNNNLNLDLNLNVKNVGNFDNLNNLNIKTNISESSINFSNSSIMWNDSIQMFLEDGYLSLENGQINLNGELKLVFKDINNVYSFFQIKKKFRKKIKDIYVNFSYNLDNKNFYFDSLKVDNISNSKLEKLTQYFNGKSDRTFNKITFKNFVNNFFSTYAG